MKAFSTTMLGVACLLPAFVGAQKCPSVSLSTKTSTKTLYPTVYTSTTTATYTSYVFSTSTISTISTSTFYNQSIVYNTYTVTQTASTATILPAKHTTTAPTVAGFTPVLCETTYRDATTTKTIYSTVSTVSSIIRTFTSSLPYTTTVYNYISITTITTSAAPYTSEVYPTVTTTVTRKSATQTVYAACASNNVVSRYPDPSGALYNVQTVDGVSQQEVAAVNATDCCGLCQATNACVGSVYHSLYPYPSCQLFISGNGTCNPKFVGGLVYPGNPEDNQEAVYISNSRCGQIDFADF